MFRGRRENSRQASHVSAEVGCRSVVAYMVANEWKQRELCGSGKISAPSAVCTWGSDRVFKICETVSLCSEHLSVWFFFCSGCSGFRFQYSLLQIWTTTFLHLFIYLSTCSPQHSLPIDFSAEEMLGSRTLKVLESLKLHKGMRSHSCRYRHSESYLMLLSRTIILVKLQSRRALCVVTLILQPGVCNWNMLTSQLVPLIKSVILNKPY